MSAARPLLTALFSRDEQRLRAVLPSSEEGWRALIHRCEELDALGLLHASLRRTRCADLAPDEVRAALRAAHAATAAQNLELVAEARRVLDAFARAGLVVAPMKGVALFVEGVVEDLGARPTCDFDLVSRRVDRGPVLATLRELGYSRRRAELSWKHLPALSRGDVAIEVHEIAYWSPRTRSTFGAEHLAIPDRDRRIGRMCALQVHHLVLGSPAEAGLLVRTLRDIDAFVDLARGEPAIRGAIAEAAREAGMERELAAADVALAGLRGEAPGLGLDAAPRDVARLLAPLDLATPASDPRILALAHALRILPIQPWSLTRDMLRLLLFPPHEAAAGEEAQSGAWRHVRRPLQLAARVVRALPAALRTRTGPGARDP